MFFPPVSLWFRTLFGTARGRWRRSLAPLCFGSVSTNRPFGFCRQCRRFFARDRRPAMLSSRSDRAALSVAQAAPTDQSTGTPTGVSHGTRRRDSCRCTRASTRIGHRESARPIGRATRQSRVQGGRDPRRDRHGQRVHPGRPLLLAVDYADQCTHAFVASLPCCWRRRFNARPATPMWRSTNNRRPGRSSGIAAGVASVCTWTRPRRNERSPTTSSTLEVM